MQVEIKIDPSQPEPKVVITAASMTEEVNRIVRRLSEEIPQVISGTRDGKLEVLEPEELIRIYAASGKVFAVTGKGEYTLRLRLYELEERLSPHQFVRISNSEIIHLKKVVNFDLSFAGTIYVKLSNGTVTYVSRRYVSKIKKILGI
ncbi:MAG: LytTR family transcriptional regulator [Ruminococcus sp.]|jgi:DNA-binding LytR/AlgR family response regulator|nr:LytTR family DNA-binding domain-containing protein [uncultured Schaedlerella sp.]MCI8769143.1 LytTR family transcriptional regulator [Ruminococcus sp.]MCI9329672.1 LytTR family transcriptional regulator [Ruminococcus sp.]NBJ02528.1 LytTR family transcriptional regulator [Lachnospiraceae bacterium]